MHFTPRRRAPWLLLVAIVPLLLVHGRGHAAGETGQGGAGGGGADAPKTITADDVSLSILTQDEDGPRVLTDAELAVHFNLARCSCAETVRARIELTAAGADKLQGEPMGVELRMGSDCERSEAADKCPLVGSGQLGADGRRHDETLGIDRLFRSVTSPAGCETSGTRSQTLWVWLRGSDGKRLSLTPSRVLKLRGTRPPAPEIDQVEPGQEALHVSWGPPSIASSVDAYQVVCDPKPKRAPQAAFSSCPGKLEAELDEESTCSAKLGADQRAVRIAGLVNGTKYTLSVIAIDAFGNPSVPSVPVSATPAKTLDFYKVYKDAKGEAQPGCSLLSGGGRPRSMPLVAVWVVAMAIVARRSRR